MEIVYSSKFAREYKKLPNSVKDIAEEVESIFREDPFDPRLKTHKLNGKLSNFLAFSIGHKYRIIFELIKGKNIAHFHSVGNHDIYKE